MDALAVTKNLTRSYNGRCALDHLDLTLNRGDVLGLLGPNGAGKSTTLRLLSGELAPDEGNIHLCGIDLQQQPEQAKQCLGYLPEQPPLLLEQQVDEFLGDCARLHRMPKPEIPDALDRVKQRCGLEQVGRRLIRNLSKGFRQRVGIAQAIINDPAVVILDEPTDGLDPGQIREVRDLIQALARERGVILSSHILPEVQAVCNRILILHQGKRVYSGDISPPTTPTLKLELEHSPDAAIFNSLPMVASATNLHTDYFHITLTPGAKAPQLAAAVVEQGWGLKSMTPEVLSLEQIFLELTSGGPGA
ncbi:MAG: ABC transporter ATP-binding protein [gamma proteobacterium endosymbiont of Lamellibrachia anaximandri]|nr:ABC transporter ATP-binding protein [gamma proteobacterium endosymbiont of Lamellibrachia anaximandri]